MLDSHCHLNDDKLFPERGKAIAEAKAAGVTLFLCVGWDVESSKKALQIAHEFPEVYAAVGIHPENLEGVSEDSLKEIETLAQDPKVVAIGEIGLDYHWYKEEKDRNNQKEWFLKEIDLANRLGLPVSIHARDAIQDTFDILKAHPVLKAGNMHCYSGPTEIMPLFAKLGFYFGFDGPITYKNSQVPKANVQSCPFDRLLSETDSPYLAPVPFRGEANSPKHIAEIVQMMAFLRGVDSKTVENQVLLNFRKLFHVEQ
jgi:TatD DNase family protein